jgi:hypothetical protein
VYFSGYNGDKRFGVPRITAFQGELFRLGGNGINPYPGNGRPDITWRADKMLGPDPTLDSGQIDFFPGVGSYHSLVLQP